MVGKNRDFYHAGAIGAVGFAVIVVVCMGVGRFSVDVDEQAQRREENIIRNGFAARTREIETQVSLLATWDDAVRHLDNAFNPDWARDNIGAVLAANEGIGTVHILNWRDEPVLGLRDGTAVGTDAFAEIRQQALPLIAEVRAREAAARTVAGGRPTLGRPVQASSPALVHERLHILTATLVQPDFGRAQLSHNTAPIIITGREVNDSFTTAFGERYLLEAMHIHEGDSRHEAGEAHVSIIDVRGRHLATIDWMPQRPGAMLMQRTLPWMLLLLAPLALATGLLHWRASRAHGRLAESERKSVHASLHDALTGLPNRTSFENELLAIVVEAARTKQALAVHYIDLDGFKEINDTFGHLVGDELIRATAARLSEISAGQIIVTRLGGDEFALAHRLMAAEEAAELAEQVVDAVAVPFALSVGVKQIGCSVGVALALDEVPGPEELMRRADLALYRAKQEGRGCYRIFEPAMDDELKRRRRLKEDLRADIAFGRLEMVYQPQVSRSGEVVGLEGLVRWKHAEFGAISPSVFIPLAEEAGLIDALGDFTLKQAAIDSRRWPGIKRIAVNVSATQIQADHFAARAASIVRAAGGAPTQVEIELTEGVFFNNTVKTKQVLEALRAAGFSIALDDFGTGYSSLSYLRSFPIDKIKIDRSFVIELGADKRSDALCSAIVNLARSLEMRVIAEGVETAEQWLRLSAAGCTQIQGYYASAP